MHGITIHAELTEEGGLCLRYQVKGMINDLAIPAPGEPVRADGLWQTTCFELFLRKEGRPAYAEFNFSPSSKWSAYEFEDYRDGITGLQIFAAPDIRFGAGESHFALETEIQLPDRWRTFPIMVGFSAIIEDRTGAKSYWALAHPPGKPDFHHKDCFALTLPAPGVP